jgi:pyridoxamine 5'-phosphate oxidase
MARPTRNQLSLMSINVRRAGVAQHLNMDLFDPAPDFARPLEALVACHRRIEQKIVTLNKLVCHIAQRGPDTEAQAAAEGVRHYFQVAAPLHHQDEELDLFPLVLLQAKKPDLQARAFDIIARMMVEHRQFEDLWLEIEPLLKKIEAGEISPFPPDLIKTFSQAHRRHIANEESVLLPMAMQLLSQEQLSALGISMKARRQGK